jgi:5-methylcytosine-specific restriction endonuclease McrA
MSWAGSHSDGFPTATARRILERNPVCMWPDCDRPSVEADHVIPKAEGGTDDESNGQGLCRGHHREKTRAEQQRGRARKSRTRPPEQHPGLRRRGGG